MKSDLDYEATQEEKNILHKIIYDAYLKKKDNIALSDVLQCFDDYISKNNINFSN